MVNTRWSKKTICPFKKLYNEALEFIEEGDEAEAVRRLHKLDKHELLSPYLHALVSVALAFHACPIAEDLIEHANNAISMCNKIEKTEFATPTLGEVLDDLRIDAATAISLEEQRRARHIALQHNKKRNWVQYDGEENMEDGRKRLKVSQNNDDDHEDDGNDYQDDSGGHQDCSSDHEDDSSDYEDDGSGNGDDGGDHEDDGSGHDEEPDTPFERYWREVMEQVDQVVVPGQTTAKMQPKEVGHEIRAISRGDNCQAGIQDSTPYIAKLVNREGKSLAVAKTDESGLFTQAFMTYASEDPVEMRKLIERYERKKGLPSFEAKAIGGEAKMMKGLSFRNKD